MSDFEVCPVGTAARLAAAEAERDALELYAVNMEDERDALLAALREIVAMTDEDSGTFRKRGGTYRGLVRLAAEAAIAKVKGGGNG